MQLMQYFADTVHLVVFFLDASDFSLVEFVLSMSGRLFLRVLL
ncbi:hypothetical protein TRIP_E80010 [uncultured Spirochaetota bacterium]|nr:hypothetical protein TRIP_E80010 [uncultured Spirochaetota bacterium]